MMWLFFIYTGILSQWIYETPHIRLITSNPLPGGVYFPDTDAANAGIDSRVLLRRVVRMVSDSGWVLANMDATIVAQAPKMGPHIPAMISRLASDLQVSASQVNIKATTTEKLGFTGREEGIAAHAVVLLAAPPT